MLAAIARFEFRQHVRGQVFWVVLSISLLMVVGSVSVAELRVGTDAGGPAAGAEAIVRTHMVWTLFFLFTNGAFVADAVLRDTVTGFAPLVQVLPISPREHLFGRFLGAFGAVLLCFLSVPVGLLLGTAMPWVMPATIVAPHLSTVLFALAIMAIPNLLLSAAMSFALATTLRSMAAALVGTILLLILYGLGGKAGVGVPPLFEPFGFAALNHAVASWPVVVRRDSVPWTDGTLLANRLLVLIAAAGLLAFAWSRYRVGPSVRLQPNEAEHTASASRLSTQSPPLGAASSFGWDTVRVQFAARLSLELRLVIATPVFAALAMLGAANATSSLWALPPSTSGAATLATLSIACRLVAITVTLFFAGEIWWREREQRIATLLGAAPIAAPTFLLPKMVSLAGVLAALAMSAAIAAIIVTFVPGHARVESVPLLAWTAATTWDWVLFACLAFFFQSVAPNKLAGWGLTVLFLIASLALDRLGLTDPLYRYDTVVAPPGAAFPAGAAFYRTYWTLIALALALSACLRGGAAIGRQANRPARRSKPPLLIHSSGS